MSETEYIIDINWNAYDERWHSSISLQNNNERYPTSVWTSSGCITKWGVKHEAARKIRELDRQKQIFLLKEQKKEENERLALERSSSYRYINGKLTDKF